jgi:hypothetical protein
MAAAMLFVTVCNLGGVAAIFIAQDQFKFNIGLYLVFLSLIVLGAAFGMVMNFWRGSSFPEMASYAVSVLVTGFSLYCLFANHAPMAIRLEDLFKALLLVNFSVAVISVVAVIAATRLDMVANLCVCTVIFFLGLMSSFLFQRETGIVAVDIIFDFCYALLPNWQFFWLVDAVAVKREIPWAYVLNAAVYVLLYTLLASVWAVALFQNREPAASSRD